MKQYEVVNVDGEAVTYTIENESEQPSGLVAKFSVFEIGNHGDISITNPFTGKRLWVSASAFDSTTNLYVAMRRVIAVAEKLHFLGDPANNLSPAHVARLLGGGRASRAYGRHEEGEFKCWK